MRRDGPRAGPRRFAGGSPRSRRRGLTDSDAPRTACRASPSSTSSASSRKDPVVGRRVRQPAASADRSRERVGVRRGRRPPGPASTVPSVDPESSTSRSSHRSRRDAEHRHARSRSSASRAMITAEIGRRCGPGRDRRRSLGRGHSSPLEDRVGHERVARRCRGVRRLRRVVSAGPHGEFQHERAPLAGLARDADVAAVLAQDLAADRQPQAGPAWRPWSRRRALNISAMVSGVMPSPLSADGDRWTTFALACRRATRDRHHRRPLRSSTASSALVTTLRMARDSAGRIEEQVGGMSVGGRPLDRSHPISVSPLLDGFHDVGRSVPQGRTAPGRVPAPC